MQGRYRPKYHRVEKRAYDPDFTSIEERPELFQNMERKQEEGQQYDLCSKLTTKLNNSIMTLVNETSEYASPFKRGSRRATTIINTPNNEGDLDS